MSGADPNTVPNLWGPGDLILAVEWAHKTIVQDVMWPSKRGGLEIKHNRETLGLKARNHLCNNSSHEEAET